MTQKEIEAADILIKGATSHGVLYTTLFHPDEEKEAFRPITNVAKKYLVEDGLLEVFQHHESMGEGFSNEDVEWLNITS